MARIKAESIRGWLAIMIVTLGGVVSATTTYYAGRAEALLMEFRIGTMEKQIAKLQEKASAFSGT